METYTLQVTVQSKESLTDDEKKGLEAVVKRGSVPDALSMKAPVSVVEAEVKRPGQMTAQLEDVKANEAVYGEEASDEAKEGFEVEVSAGRQIALTFDREKESIPREILIEQQEDDLVVIAASERGLDADGIIRIGRKSSTMESNSGAPDGRTFNGTERVG